MLALIIIGSILGLLLLLLLIPLRLELIYNSDIRLRLEYGWLRFKLFPRADKPKNKRVKQTKAEKKHTEKTPQPNFIKQLIDQQGYAGAFQTLKQYALIAFGAVESVAKHLVIAPFRLRLVMTGPDAADLAIQYGQLCAVLYPFLSFLQSRLRFEDHKTDIRVDYLKKEPELYFYVKVRIRPLFVLTAALRAVCKLVIQTIQIKTTAKERNVSL